MERKELQNFEDKNQRESGRLSFHLFSFQNLSSDKRKANEGYDSRVKPFCGLLARVSRVEMSNVFELSNIFRERFGLNASII